MLKRRLQTANCADPADRADRTDRTDRADRALLAPEFRLFHFARHWQIRSWPITQSTSISIQFYSIMRLFSAWEKNDVFSLMKFYFTPQWTWNESKKIWFIFMSNSLSCVRQVLAYGRQEGKRNSEKLWKLHSKWKVGCTLLPQIIVR